MKKKNTKIREINKKIYDLLASKWKKDSLERKSKKIKSIILLSILLTGILLHPNHVQAETEAQLAFNGLYHHMERR